MRQTKQDSAKSTTVLNGERTLLRLLLIFLLLATAAVSLSLALPLVITARVTAVR